MMPYSPQVNALRNYYGSTEPTDGTNPTMPGNFGPGRVRAAGPVGPFTMPSPGAGQPQTMQANGIGLMPSPGLGQPQSMQAQDMTGQRMPGGMARTFGNMQAQMPPSDPYARLAGQMQAARPGMDARVGTGSAFGSQQYSTPQAQMGGGMPMSPQVQALSRFYRQ